MNGLGAVSLEAGQKRVPVPAPAATGVVLGKASATDDEFNLEKSWITCAVSSQVEKHHTRPWAFPSIPSQP